MADALALPRAVVAPRAKPISVRATRMLVYAVLGIAALYFLLPLYVMIVTSLKTMDEIRGGNLLMLPRALDVTAWLTAWASACTGVHCEGIRGYFWNSVLIVLPATVISTFLGSINGYVLSKWRFPGSQVVFGMLLFGLFLPFQVVLLPMAQTLGVVGLAQSLAGLVFVHIVYGLPVALFFRNFYVSIPDELVNAARIDGAGFFRIFFRILLPLSPPIIGVCLIWQVTQVWNDFLFGVVFSAGQAQPVTVALNNLVNTSTGTKEYNVHMAAAIIAALPTLAVYLLSGKYFVRGLMAGAVKG